MVNGYTAIIKRVMVIALLIALPTCIKASEHGNMAKRHKISCGRIVMAWLFASTGYITQAMNCVGYSGTIRNQPFRTNIAVCSDDADIFNSAARATMNSVHKTSTTANLRKFKVDCPTEAITKDNGLKGTVELCVPLHDLEQRHFDLGGSNSLALPTVQQ